MPTADIEPGVKLHVSGSTVYAALKNLLMQHYGMTRETLMAEVLRVSNVEGIVRDWMGSQTMRDFVSRMVREAIAKMVDGVLREEVRAAISGKVRITLSE